MIRSPIYSHFAQSLDGVIRYLRGLLVRVLCDVWPSRTSAASVRAYSLVPAFKQHHEKLVDSLNTVYWPMTSLNRWLGLRLEWLGSSIIAATGLTAVFTRITGNVTHESGALLALTLTFVLGITHEMGW